MVRVLNFIVACVAAYDQSFQNCLHFVSLWDNTCQSGPVDNSQILSQTGSNVSTLTCSGDESWCAGSAQTDPQESSCTHKSYMCLACLTYNGEVKIRVQSNNMPNTCWQTNPNSPNVADYVNVDFRVTWNADMTRVLNYLDSDFATPADVDTVLCDLQRTSSSNMHSSITYVEVDNSISMDHWSGFTRNNVALYNGLDITNQDIMETASDEFDGCLSRASANDNAQHVHTISPCVNGNGAVGSQTRKPGACGDNLDCFPKDNSYELGSWSTLNAKFGGVYGLARDGHVIFGPYNGDGELWTCDDVDQCNGFFLDDGSYGYASTTFFPYTVGCWGPAPTGHTYKPGCSQNACGFDASVSSIGFSALVIGILSLNAAL